MWYGADSKMVTTEIGYLKKDDDIHKTTSPKQQDLSSEKY
jgi:hypothetical protein